MKKVKLELVLTCCVLGVSMMMGGCKKGTSVPFQGPQDPSFETSPSGWYITYTASGGTEQGGSYAGIKTGTGFLPSNGINYAYLTTYNVFNPAPEATLYQDNVDLTHSTTMSFDYSFSGTLGASGGTATIKILFTSNGTSTLWTKTIDNTSTLPDQKTNETITLPSTTVTGRLTIVLDAVGGVSYATTPASITQTNVTFGIDNITVK
jgi:hypothetical protein